jgi:hypothetical protein
MKNHHRQLRDSLLSPTLATSRAAHTAPLSRKQKLKPQQHGNSRIFKL